MPLRHVLKGRDTAGGIYGTVVATSVVVGLSKDPQLTPGQALLILTVTTTVFMLAKVYALSLSERATLGTLSSWGRAAELARYEWPMLRAAAPAALAIVLWWAGACGRSTGLWLAVGLGVAELAPGDRLRAERGAGRLARAAHGRRRREPGAGAGGGQGPRRLSGRRRPRQPRSTSNVLGSKLSTSSCSRATRSA